MGADVEVNPVLFLQHISKYHANGNSIHKEDGRSFKIDNDQSDYGVFVSEGKLWLVCFKTENVDDWEILATSSAFSSSLGSLLIIR